MREAFRAVRRRRWVATVGALLAAAVAHASALEGRAPVTPARPEPLLDQRYLQKTTGTVGKPDPPVSVVYLEDAARPSAARGRGEPPRIAQVHFQFDPGLLVVPTGTRVAFPNGDDTYHNIFSYSEAKRFDLGRYRKEDEAPAVLFDRPGLVRLFCEIHEHMRGYILVLDTPFFAKTDAEGNFRLDGVPPGRYRLKVWIDPKRTLEREIELRDGEVRRLDLTAAGP